MKSCNRCRRGTPAGLRFCNHCGARLGAAHANHEDVAAVFGNLALDLEPPAPSPEEVPASEGVYAPPRHLRALPDPVPGPKPLARAQELAGRARELAGKAGAVARKVGASAAGAAQTLAQKVLESRLNEGLARPTPPSAMPWETQYPAAAGHAAAPDPHRHPAAPPAPAAPAPPVAAVPPPRGPAKPAEAPGSSDLREGYVLYQKGRRAYELGDREQAKRLFVAALRASPPGSPLANFLGRVLRPRSPEAPVTARPAVAPLSPGATVRPATPAGPAARAATPDPRPRAPAPPRGSPPPPPPRAAARHLRVVPPAPPTAAPADPAEASRLLEERAAARASARETWVGALPGAGPRRPSVVLDTVEPLRMVETMATGAVVLAVLAFAMLLFL